MVKIIYDCLTLSGKKWINCENTSHLFSYDGLAKCSKQKISSKEFSANYGSVNNVCEDCVKSLAADDVIIKQIIDTAPYRQFKFPEIQRCRSCSANLGVKFGRHEILSSDVANDVELIEYAYKMMERWDNPMPKRHVCECKTLIPQLTADILEKLCVIFDTGWVGKSGGRCITDFSRRMTFGFEPTSEQLTGLIKLLSLKDCPGYTGVTVTKKDACTYEFFTTNDSSD